MIPSRFRFICQRLVVSRMQPCSRFNGHATGHILRGMGNESLHVSRMQCMDPYVVLGGAVRTVLDGTCYRTGLHKFLCHFVPDSHCRRPKKDEWTRYSAEFRSARYALVYHTLTRVESALPTVFRTAFELDFSHGLTLHNATSMHVSNAHAYSGVQV